MSAGGELNDGIFGGGPTPCSRHVNPDNSQMTGVSDLTDDEQLALARKATEFLTAFRWCASVRESYLAFDIGYVLGVFLFRIEPRLVGVEDTLWVVVGDLPPAFSSAMTPRIGWVRCAATFTRCSAGSRPSEQAAPSTASYPSTFLRPKSTRTCFPVGSVTFGITYLMAFHFQMTATPNQGAAAPL